MRGPKPLYSLVLTDAEVAQLRQLIRAHSTSQVQVLRARIVLMAAEQPHCSNAQIAQTVGTSDRMVRKWRRRWLETHSLEDAPRPGAPRRFSPCGAGAGHRDCLQPALRRQRRACALESR